MSSNPHRDVDGDGARLLSDGELDWERPATSADGTGDGAMQPDPDVRARLLALDRKKGEVEAKVARAQHYLQTTSVGERGSLIDAEGFPKSDIDHYAVREARHAIDCGRNDLRRINDRMMVLLTLRQQQQDAAPSATAAEVSTTSSTRAAPPPPPAAAAAAQGSGDTTTAGGGQSAAAASSMDVDDDDDDALEAPPPPPPLPPALFKVTAVSPSSPASEAGLAVDDRVLRFGSVTVPDLRRVAALVKACVGVVIPVEVIRVPSTSAAAAGAGAASLHTAHLTPHEWQGAGLLGCTLTTDGV